MAILPAVSLSLSLSLSLPQSFSLSLGGRPGSLERKKKKWSAIFASFQRTNAFSSLASSSGSRFVDLLHTLDTPGVANATMQSYSPASTKTNKARFVGALRQSGL